MSRKGAPAPAAPLPDLTTTKEVINALKQLYMEKMRPIEVAYNFAEVCAGVQFLLGVCFSRDVALHSFAMGVVGISQFHSPYLRASDFEAKPMVLLLGQYSVGKTSFIRYLLGRDFPGIRIGMHANHA